MHEFNNLPAWAWTAAAGVINLKHKYMQKKRLRYYLWPEIFGSKALRIMKTSVIVMLAATLTVSANVNLLAQRVDLTFRNADLSEVLQSLREQTGHVIIYSESKLDSENRKVSIDLRDATLESALDALLKGMPYTYKVVDQRVLIIPAPASQTSPQAVRRGPIRGRVTDEGGTALPGVAVIVKGTAIGTASDADGNFELTGAPDGDITLSFSFLGKEPVEVSYTGQPSVIVAMREGTQHIEDVVVTGIFTKARESYTGSVTTITKEDLRQSGNRSVLSQIRNIDPAFNVIEDNAYGSDPNRLPEIRLRGSTALGTDIRDLQDDIATQGESNLPLFVVDGFEVKLQRVMDMDENAIESITILKDASATALYGSRGANGVIVITTSRPPEGKILITYRGSLNIEAPDFSSYNLMNAREKLDYELSAGLYDPMFDGSPADMQSRRELYNQHLSAVERGVDTYWLKYPVRTGVGHKHSLRGEGGTDAVRYGIGISYNDIAGVMKDSGRKTLNGNVFLQYNLKNVSFQNDLTLTNNKSTESPYGNFSQYTLINPYYKPYDDEGNLVRVLGDYWLPDFGYRTAFIANPLYDATLPYRDDREYFNVQNNFAVEWNILPGLSARGRFSVTKYNDEYNKYISRNNTKYLDYTEDNYNRRGEYRYETNKQLSYEWEVTLNYTRTFAEKHQFYAGLSYNQAQSRGNWYRFDAEGFPAADIDDIGAAMSYAKDGKPYTSDDFSRRLGGIANVNYTYDRRYFVDLSGKLEGSSKFGSGNKIAPFWSVGAGWNIHNERFFAQNNVVNSLRLRLSYGITGSQNFNAYQALTTYKYYNDVSYRNWVGASMMGLGNEDLRWQQTAQLNAGIETLLFDGRLRLNFDFYNKLTDDLLSDINVPTSAGISSYKANIGKVRNRGVEAYANVIVLRNTERGFSWSVGASLVHNKNKIMKISNALKKLNEELNAEAGANPSFLYEEGQSMNTIYVVRSLGINPGNGREIFLKPDGTTTYTWDARYKVPYAVEEPKVMGNLNTTLRYRNLSLNMVFSYRLGGYIYNQTLIDKVENIDAWNNADRRAYYDRWKTAGDDVFFKSVRDRTQTRASSRFVMKENTITCRSINLNYELDSEWTKRHLGLEYIAVGLYTEDVFRISSIKLERGTAYPFARKFSLSLTARF